MDKRLENIRDDMQRITHTAKKDRFPVMSGTVLSVDGQTVNVALTVDINDENGDVDCETPANLNVTLNNTAGIYGVPTVGANCLVAEIDGPGMWELIKADSYSNVYISAGTLIQFNGGGLGALVVLSKLQDNLKAIHDYIFNTLQPAIEQALTAVGEGSGASGSAGEASFSGAVAGQDITFEDMSNSKITQG